MSGVTLPTPRFPKYDSFNESCARYGVQVQDALLYAMICPVRGGYSAAYPSRSGRQLKMTSDACACSAR